MSRRISWCLAFLAMANLVPAASACPGLMTIGLPLLFGPSETPTAWPTPSNLDSVPIIDLKLPAEEAQESPPSRKEQAQECLKVWRQLVRDTRFDQAAIVAAKAAALDPTNIDVQRAVMVSTELNNIAAVNHCRQLTIAKEKCPAIDANAQAALKHMFPSGLLHVDSRPLSSEQPKAQCCKPCPTSDCHPTDCSATLTTGPCRSLSLEKGKADVRVTLNDAQASQDVPSTIHPNVIATSRTEMESPARNTTCCESCASKVMAVKGLATGGVTAGGVFFNTSRCEGSCGVAIATKRVSIETAKWQIECDRIVRANDQEIVVEGDVKVTMRQHGATVRGNRIHLSLTDGMIRTDERN